MIELLHELTRVRLGEVAADALLVVPFGAIEQHGPHLPFGTDFLIVEAIARRAVDDSGADGGSAIVLAPTVPYGSSGHHLAVGGALSLAPPTFEAVAHGLFESAADSGFRRIFAINGHGGNEQLLRIAAQAAARGRPLAIAGGSYWSLAHESLTALAGPESTIPGHAGRFETALVLALRPDLVSAVSSREQQAAVRPSSFWHEDDRAWSSIDGYTDSPAQATAEEGEQYLAALVAGVADSLREFDRATRGTFDAGAR